ncbi:MAG: dihydrolipoamide acetyltransferase family protein, partial [Anaerolineae bacterium]
RIIKRDIEAYVQAREKAPEVQPKPPIPTPSYEPTLEEYEAVPLSGMRKTIARRMVESKQQVPHIYLTLSIDMAAAMKLRKELNAYLDEDSRVSVNDMVVKASAIALRQFPNLNASFGGDELRLNKRVNVGIAVAREAGLLTVVIKDVDQKSLGQIGREARTLAGKAREGRMAVEDMMDGTFTVSNLGMFGIEDFVAIVNPPQAAILAVGTVQQVPGVDTDGQVAVGTRMKVTLSSDHRVTDGAESAQFLQALKKALEEPMRLLV